MKVRAARLEDHAPIAAVLRRNGLTCPDYDGWAHLWVGHPCRDQLRDVAIGWVLEDAGGSVVGTFGNIPLIYEYGGRRLRAAAASAWAVDPRHRRGSLLLLGRFFQQKNVDLLLDTTADAPAAKAFEAFKARRVPHPEYDQALFWPTRFRAFAAAVLRRRHRMLGALALPAAFVLRGLDALRGWGSWRHLPASDPEVGTVVALNGFDARFDSLWAALRRRFPERLMAARDRATLEWHFRSARKPLVLGLEKAGELTGYVVLIRRDRQEIGLRRLQVADLQVAGEDPAAVRTLIAAALRQAREDGIGVVEAIGFGPAKRQALISLSPRRRRLPSWPFFYKATDPRRLPELDRVAAWDPSPYDGDASL